MPQLPKSVKRLRNRKVMPRYIVVDDGCGETSFDVAKELSFDHTSLSDTFMVHHEQQLYWGRLLAQAKSHLRQQRDNLKDAEDLAFIKLRNFYDAEYQKPSNVDPNPKTDGYCRAQSTWDDDVQRIRKEVRKAEEAVDALQSIVTAFEHRRSGLMSAGAYQRDDLKGSLQSRTHLQTER